MGMLGHKFYIPSLFNKKYSQKYKGLTFSDLVRSWTETAEPFTGNFPNAFSRVLKQAFNYNIIPMNMTTSGKMRYSLFNNHAC